MTKYIEKATNAIYNYIIEDESLNNIFNKNHHKRKYDMKDCKSDNRRLSLLY